jgi:hypothetical protein
MPIASGMIVKTTLSSKNWQNVNISLAIKLNYDNIPLERSGDVE